MNVLVVTNMYPTERNVFYGAFVKDQVESLRKLGVHVDVYFINGQDNRLNYFTSIGGLAKLLRASKYDIIHAHHSYCLLPARIARGITRRKCPLILTFHEGEVHWSEKASSGNIDLIKRLVFSKRIKYAALRVADFVIAVQEELITELGFTGNWTVIPCGVDVDSFMPRDQKSCRERLNLPLDKRIIFFPASMENKQKGFDILVKAVKHLRRSDVHLMAAGNIRHEEIPFYMSAADVVAQLSFFEASPSVIKEAMAANVPLVFTDSGDAKRIMQGIEGYFLCERKSESVADVLSRALNFKGQCNGRDRILKLNLNLEGVSEKIIGVYEQLLR